MCIEAAHLPNRDILLRSSCSSNEQRNLYCQSLHFLGDKNHLIQRWGDETRQANYIYCKFTNTCTKCLANPSQKDIEITTEKFISYIR